ncbi:hypothetical protein [Rhodococcus sp. ARC_M6]|uniref:hypothetical protein n=1 Tax=Rhodococcus sp. ARC_M6 TaxID=2928852 RepID=UPI001FB39FB1|nr:hypothetical protein [Rhodococcus sp. ARC_M6]MCJ0905093.1 hypothetical protein [Rhodococcus sp. ARC_M6]
MEIDHSATDELERRTMAAAHQLSVAAGMLASPAFSGSCAGRDYVEYGRALAEALDGLQVRITERALFLEDLGTRIGDSSRTVVEIDRDFAARLRSVGSGRLDSMS